MAFLMSARKALISVHRTCSALAAYGAFLVSCAGNKVPFSPPPLRFPQLSSPYTSETTVTTDTWNNWSTAAEILQEFRTAFTSEKAALRWYLSSCSSSLCSCRGKVPGLVSCESFCSHCSPGPTSLPRLSFIIR